jgi:hypothetical protein
VENLSLKALKAQNDEKAEAIEQPVIENTQEELVDNETEDETVIESAKSEGTTTEDGVEKTEEVEGWMQTESTENSDDQKSGFVPNAEAARKRKQNKALRGTVAKQDSELETLREKLNAYESGNAPQVTQQESSPAPRPTREAFDYDDDSYDAAVDAWNDARFDKKMQAFSQTSVKQQQAEQVQQDANNAQDKSLNDHYERANTLVDSGKVSAESYQAADSAVRMAMESVFPNGGDQITNTLISTLNTLGAGSEKVMYQLGVNPQKLDELKSLLRSDPNGLKAAAYLGKLQTEVQSPRKRRSQAPKPGSKVEGSSNGKSSDAVAAKAYAKSTDPGTRIRLKRKAKADGVDTSNWK